VYDFSNNNNNNNNDNNNNNNNNVRSKTDLVCRTISKSNQYINNLKLKTDKYNKSIKGETVLVVTFFGWKDL